MNSEKIAEFNRKAAEHVWPECSCELDEDSFVIVKDEFGREVYSCFDPYHDANDRNKVLEKMHIQTWWDYTCDMWGADKDRPQFDIWIIETGKTMEAAQIACIASVLGVNQ